MSRPDSAAAGQNATYALSQFPRCVDPNADPNKLLMFTHVRTKEKQPYRKIGLIAGGSGITPCLQVAEALLSARKGLRCPGRCYCSTQRLIEGQKSSRNFRAIRVLPNHQAWPL